MIERLAADMADQPAALARLATAYNPEGRDKGRLKEASRILGGGDQVLVGSGASHAACVAAAAAWRMDGIPAEAPEAGEFLHYDPRLTGRRAPVVVVTYSGESAEAAAIVEARRRVGAYTVLVTERRDSPLAGQCHLTLPLHCGRETATATKSFTNTLGLLIAVGAACRHRAANVALADCAGRMATMLGDPDGVAERILDSLGGVPGHLDVVGRGPGFGTALYAGLMLRELLAIRGGWMTPGHFRHGPLLDVGADHRLIVIAGRHRLDLGARLAADAAARGGRAVLIADGPAPPTPGVLVVPIEAPDEATFALLAAVPFELVMAQAARIAGTRYVRIQTTTE